MRVHSHFSPGVLLFSLPTKNQPNTTDHEDRHPRIRCRLGGGLRPLLLLDRPILVVHRRLRIQGRPRIHGRQAQSRRQVLRPPQPRRAGLLGEGERGHDRLAETVRDQARPHSHVRIRGVLRPEQLRLPVGADPGRGGAPEPGPRPGSPVGRRAPGGQVADLRGHLRAGAVGRVRGRWRLPALHQGTPAGEVPALHAVQGQRPLRPG